MQVCTYGQNNSIDSLKRIIKISNEDIEKFEALSQLHLFRYPGGHQVC